MSKENTYEEDRKEVLENESEYLKLEDFGTPWKVIVGALVMIAMVFASGYIVGKIDGRNEAQERGEFCLGAVVTTNQR